LVHLSPSYRKNKSGPFLRHGVHVRKQDHSIWNHIRAALELVLLRIRVLDETGSW